MEFLKSFTIIEYPFPIMFEGTIIDFETDGLPSQDSSPEIVTVGLLGGGKVTIVQRCTREKGEFYAEILRIINKQNRPFYSYNASFERSIFRTELGIEFNDSELVDIMAPWKMKANETKRATNRRCKWPKLDELVSEPEDYFRRKKVNGALVPSLWKEYLTKPDWAHPLWIIIHHCASDVQREAFLLLNKPNPITKIVAEATNEIEIGEDEAPSPVPQSRRSQSIENSYVEAMLKKARRGYKVAWAQNRPEAMKMFATRINTLETVLGLAPSFHHTTEG